jgi:hypothetical protein
MLDQNDDMPDMTLRKLDTECIESRSEFLIFLPCAWLRNETYSAGEESECRSSRRTFIGPTGTLSSSNRERR